MSILTTTTISDIDKKIEYLLNEKSLVLTDELRMTDEVLKKIRTSCQRYYPEDSSQTYQKNIVSKKSKSIGIASVMILIPILLVSIFSSNLNSSFVNDNTELKSGYVIQNLKGDTVGTFHSWDIPKERTLYVSIANPNVIDSDKIQIIKDVILSEKTVSLDNSILHKAPSGSKSTYFLGWESALKQASQTDTKFSIPTSFSINEGSTNGDISIILSTLESPDGYSGYTRSTVENNQIFKSVITIYKANQLSSAELETIVRHEFGHAVGLIHSSDPTDLMHPTIQTNYPFISQCDVSALTHLYDGNTNDKGICEI